MTLHKRALFYEFLKNKEAGLIKPLGEREWNNEKVYFVEEILDFVEEYFERVPLQLQTPVSSANLGERHQWIISDEELDKVWGNANFGSRTKREVIHDALMQRARNYRTGHTAEQIMTELGLFDGKRLTNIGIEVMFEYEAHKETT